jgi:transposase
VEQVLVPTLLPGALVVLDNLCSHKVEGVAEAVAKASLQLLPPYSPDYVSIKKMWSKVKARTQAALDEAVRLALAAVTVEDAHGWFKFCGYRHTLARNALKCINISERFMINEL